MKDLGCDALGEDVGVQRWGRRRREKIREKCRGREV